MSSPHFKARNGLSLLAQEELHSKPLSFVVLHCLQACKIVLR
jgi:hypothetical protein